MNIKRSITFYLLLLLTFYTVSAQQEIFTRQDSIRGSVTPEREWWDLTYYHLSVAVSPSDSSINGSVDIYYKVLSDHDLMQIDLQPPLKIMSVFKEGEKLKTTREGNAWYIEMPWKKVPGDIESITVSYEGRPKISRRPPWDGGVSWKYDSKGNPFVVTTCQGDGASLWWPCKDHMYDEPDSMLISVTTPGDLIGVSNGRLRKSTMNSDGTVTWHWFVSNPINNYGVNINVAAYVSFGEVYNGELGELDCEYWVLPENLEKARKQFLQAPAMLEAFEHWFGPYPFYEDSYKLVEVPYPGMEHQSSVTYGNGYRNGYGGRDMSKTGWGDLFDFILVHESGHEWFANNITYRDIADMWIHESFIAYSEGLFVEYWHGRDAGYEYLRGVRSNISNDRPIIGKYDVNYAGSGDMYPKGANMLHTLRQLVNDDAKWREILRGLNKEFWHQTVTSKQIEGYISAKTKLGLNSFFNQYLRDTRIPVLEYRFVDNTLTYRWGNAVKGFDMAVRVYIGSEEVWLNPKSGSWSVKRDIGAAPLKVDPNFYVGSMNLTGS